jgi:uncharacterized protein YndB with AHSA1/START domain
MTTQDATRGGVVEREVMIAARPEIVFRLLTDPQELLRWQGIDAEIDARPGGRFRVRLNDLGHAEEGRFIEVTPFSRIVLTWGWAPGPFDIPAGSTTVEYTLTPEGDGTRLHLLHHGLPQTPEVAAAHGVGWDHYLARLALVAAGGDAPDDPWKRGAMQD